MEMPKRKRPSGPKCAALLGPMSSGKTTLLEAILARTGAIAKQNAVGSGQTVGDHSPEARAHEMSVEATIATTDNMGDSLTIVDCPGSVEFAMEADPVLQFSDFAIVVVDAEDLKLPALQVTLRRIDALDLPRIIFINKIDKATGSIRDALEQLQSVSSKPLALRQIPIRKDGVAVGSIDLALERAYLYRDHAEAEVTTIPEEEKAREEEARFSMLEKLADFDDVLMEQLLEDQEPPSDVVFNDLTSEICQGHITPVLLGSAEKGSGILRLLKTVRHDAPDVETTRQRLGLDDADSFTGGVMKTIQTSHAGKLSVVRVLRGKVSDGDVVINGGQSGNKVSGVYTMLGKDTEKVSGASAGETVALGKLDNASTGCTIVPEKTQVPEILTFDPVKPVYAMGVRPRERRDEVKLSTALQRLQDEDPSLKVEHNQESAETILHGQGEMHLRVAIERLQNRSQIELETFKPSIPYRETISKSITQRGRHKKQSGGHGQFGDVVLEIKPQPRDAGFQFTNTITGGVVPKQFIPSVETGVKDYLSCGPLGFPVVDVSVNLSDGSYHSVDSSDMAFQLAGKLAMREGMPGCRPVLLEPVMKVGIHTPSDATAKVTTMVPQRRGQILGFEPREGWPGWDTVHAMIPQSEMQDMIIELRSFTAGVASYTAEFDHMEKLEGRLADQIVNARNEAAA